jgi:aryl-phospho-beta-D-glucosidase BglC (GH1 family)
MNGNIVYRVARVLAVLVVATTAASAMAAGYFTQGGKIYDATGQEVELRGISHHGFGSPILQPQFLWAMGWKEQIAQIKSLGFNAIRVPFVPDTLYNTTPVNQLSYVDPGRNPELLGKTPLQVLDLWMAEANRQGLYLLATFTVCRSSASTDVVLCRIRPISASSTTIRRTRTTGRATSRS